MSEILDRPAALAARLRALTPARVALGRTGIASTPQTCWTFNGRMHRLATLYSRA